MISRICSLWGHHAQVGVQLAVPTKNAEGISEGGGQLSMFAATILVLIMLNSQRVNPLFFGDKLPLPHALKHAETCWNNLAEAATPDEPGQDAVAKPESFASKGGKKHEFDDWDDLSKYNIYIYVIYVCVWLLVGIHYCIYYMLLNNFMFPYVPDSMDQQEVWIDMI